MPLAIEQPFKVGQWTVDPERHLLLDDNNNQSPNDIAPSLMSLLCYLASNHGKVVSRDELITHVWQGNVVSDESVSRSIAFLRKSLGDSAKSPRYIKTISKQGYQFLLAPQSVDAQVPSEVTSQLSPQSSSKAKHSSNFIGLAGILAISMVVILAAYLIWPNNQPINNAPNFSKMHKLPLSSHQKINRHPRFSPDGRFVISTQFSDEKKSLVLRDLSNNSERVLFSAEQDSFLNPTFSPDSEEIVYARVNRTKQEVSCALMIYTFKTNQNRAIKDCEALFNTNLSFTFDSKKLIATELKADRSTAGLVEIDIKSGQSIPLLFPEENNTGYLFPRLSPSNQQILSVAFNGRTKVANIALFNLSSKKVQLLARQFTRVQQVVWGKNDNEIYFSDTNNTGSGIWHMDLLTQETTFVYNGDVRDFDVDPNTLRFVANINMKDLNIHVAHLTEDGQIEHQTLLDSTANERRLSLSHDGNRLAYVANHNNHSNLWVKDLISNENRQFTHFKSGIITSANWSKDDQKLALTRTHKGHSQLYVIDAQNPDTSYNKIEHIVFADWHDNSSQLTVVYDEADTPGVYLLDLPEQTQIKLLDESVYSIATLEPNRYIVQVIRYGKVFQVQIEQNKPDWQPLPGASSISDWRLRDSHITLVNFNEHSRFEWSVMTLPTMQLNHNLITLVDQAFYDSFILDNKNQRFFYDKNDSKRMDLFLIEPLKNNPAPKP